MVKKKTHYSKRYTTQKTALRLAHKVKGAMTNARYISGQKTGYVVYKVGGKKPKGWKTKLIEY